MILFKTTSFTKSESTHRASNRSISFTLHLQTLVAQPLLPAYNKYMGAVDLTDQLVKPYGLDRNSSVAGFDR